MNRYHRRRCRSPGWPAVAPDPPRRHLHPGPPGTLPCRLGAAGFTRVAVNADERLVRFVAYTPGAAAEARPAQQPDCGPRS
jgi:hypothetical protein